MPVVSAQVIPPPYSAAGVRQWIPAFLLDTSFASASPKHQQQHPQQQMPPAHLLEEDCCERLATCCCFQATCFASCDAPILDTQRKAGVYKRADAPAALASRIKVYAAAALWNQAAVSFVFVIGIMLGSWFPRDVGDIVTFSVGVIPVVLSIIPLSVAVHQFSKGRLGRRVPSNCCSLGATTFPSIAGSLHNWMILCSICAAFAFVTTLSVIAARSGSRMAQGGVGYAYGWCGTGVIEEDYWDGSGSWCGYGNGEDCLWPSDYTDAANEPYGPDSRGYGEAAEELDGSSGDVMVGSGNVSFPAPIFPNPPKASSRLPLDSFGLPLTDTPLVKSVPFNYGYNTYNSYNTYYDEPMVGRSSGSGHGHSHLVVYILLMLFQAAASVLQVGLAVSLQRFKVAMLELGDGSPSRSINLSVHEAQHLWQLQVGAGDVSCNADGSFDV